MKALPSIAFNEFRGTSGDVTARKVGGSTVLNGRTQHSHVKTPKQAERRGHFGFITRRFKTLTEEQRSAWEALALQHREKALTGSDEPLTAVNLFVCLNANRALLGVPLTLEAPEYIHGSSYIAFDDIWITPSRFMIRGLRDPDNANARLVVRVASTSSKGVSKLWGSTVILGKFFDSDWGDVELTEAYTAQFGVPIIVGNKYFIEMYWMDEYSGYISQITRVCYPAVEEKSIHGEDYAARERITQKDMVSNTMNSVQGMSVEFTSGSPLVSVQAELDGIQGIAASYAYFGTDVNIPYEENKLQAAVLARGQDGHSAQVYEMTVTKATDHYDGSIVFSYRGGKYQKPSDVIGGGLLFEV